MELSRVADRQTLELIKEFVMNFNTESNPYDMLEELEPMIAQASAGPEQEPVAWVNPSVMARLKSGYSAPACELSPNRQEHYGTTFPLYTHADPSEVERLRDALIDIISKVKGSRTVTRRLMWIERRAQSALEGKEWVKQVFMMPDPRMQEGKAERLRFEVKKFRSDLETATQRADAAERKLGEAVGLLRRAYQGKPADLIGLPGAVAALLSASAEPAKCCTPTAEERQLLANGDYRPEELWGGDRPTCPKCVNQPDQYTIGDLTFERVFKASGLTNLSDMQAVLNQVERALAKGSDGEPK